MRPGGALLIAGHHPSDLQATMPRPPMPELLFTGEDIAAPPPAPDGRPVKIRDTVFRARRGG